MTSFFVQPECIANQSSEACVWGYMSYAIALFAGGILYLLVSFIQFIASQTKANGKTKSKIKTIIMWILCLPLAGLAFWATMLVIALVESTARLTVPLWIYGFVGFPIFTTTVWLVAPIEKWIVALGAYILIVVSSYSFLSGFTKADSVTPDYLPMIVGYSAGAATVFLIWLLTTKAEGLKK